MRIGISLGDVTLEDGDVFGTTVIEASRLCAAANGGQILATGVVATLAGGRGGHVFTDVGPLELKGLPEPVSAVEIGWERVHAIDRVPFPPALVVRDGAFPFSGRNERSNRLPPRPSRGSPTARRDVSSSRASPGPARPGSRPSSPEARTTTARPCCPVAATRISACRTSRSSRRSASSSRPWRRRPGAARAPRRRSSRGSFPRSRARFGDVGPRAIAGDAETEQYRLFEAVDSWLAAAVGANGWCWCSTTSTGRPSRRCCCCVTCLRSSSAARVLIVGDLPRHRSRSDAPAGRPARRPPAGPGGGARLPLGGLDLDGIEELIVAVNGVRARRVGRELAAAVHAETEGNPFFVGELFRHLAESGAIVNDGTQWRLATAVSEMSLPDGVREVVGRRLHDCRRKPTTCSRGRR